MNPDHPTNEPGEHGPFISPLEQIGTGRRETFHQLESRPDLFIRRRDVTRVNTERSHWSSEQFDKLRAAGVKVPNFRTTVGGGPDGPVEYLIVDRIQGETVDELTAAGHTLPTDAVNRMFHGMTHYFHDAQVKDEAVVWDFATRQLMYGHTAADPQDDLYFVDVDPTFRNLDAEVLMRVGRMMQEFHEHTPINADTWATMRQLIITNDENKNASAAELDETKAWLEANMPPTKATE